VTVIVQLVPLELVAQSGLVAIVIESGVGSGLGVAPLTVYNPIVIVAVLGEIKFGFRVLELVLLFGMTTRTVAPVVCGTFALPVCGRALEPPPPPPPHAHAKTAKPNRTMGRYARFIQAGVL
jgi:hypothetical protein